MNFLCPSCRTPLPRAALESVTCTGCGVAVDLARVETAPGQARLWPEVDLSGESLGGYTLVKLLGSGGMGTVYEARAADGAHVALKVLAPLLAAEPALRERFRREARALAAIQHPGVVKMLGEGEERSFCWYAMERVEGEDLRKRLERGPLPAAEVVALAKAVLDALEAVHAAGFVHRDVKPSNILLAASGPKLCDFGIARLDGATTLTESAAVLGSLRYMAPEQRWGKCDERSDLYALGVVLHEALALGVPGERTLPGSTPTALARLIERLTSTSPSRRPESAAAARRLLARVSLRDVRVAAAAVVLLGVVGAGVAVSLIEPMDSLLAEPVDAGVALAMPTEAPDAGMLALAEPLDAGTDAGGVALSGEEDAGSDAGVLAEVAADAGAELFAGLSALPTKGTRGSPPPPKPKLTKPIKVALGTDLGSKGDLGIKGSGVAEALGPQGSLRVSGVGSARVSVGKQEVGNAPGAFSLPFGTFAVRVRCGPFTKSKKKAPPGRVFDFEVTLSAEKPTAEVSYDCTAPG